PVWVAALDRSIPPSQLTALNARKAYFGAGGEILFLGDENGTNILYAAKTDGSGSTRMIARPQYRAKPTNLDDYGLSVSANGRWVVMRGTNDIPGATMVYSVVEGGSPVLICESCAGVISFERGPPPPFVSWSPDGRIFYLNFQGLLYAVPVRPGEA